MYGEEIKRNRIIAGYTQKEVSIGTGIPQNTISWIELNKGIANIYQCVLLANFYNISIDELIGRYNNTNEKNLNINNSFNNINNTGNFNL